MNVFTALRNATLFSAVAVAGMSSAFAVDPGLAPRSTDPGVPQPQDPYGSFVVTPGTPYDPFSPNNGLGTPGMTMPPGTIDPRLAPSVVPPTSSTPSDPGRWRLGVFSTDTAAGVQIVRLANGPSPAAAAGLEPDDVIVAVAGHQVGYVNNVRRELSQEFNAHAGTDGYVPLLVQDHRSRTLMNLTVRLEARFDRVQGTLGIPAGARLPQGATAHVALQEIVRPGVVVPLVTKTVNDLYRTPIPFTLDVDPSLIDSRRQYVVHADITDGRQTLYTTRTPYRVLSDGYPRTVDMRLYPTATQLPGTGYVPGGGYAYNRETQLNQVDQWYHDYLNRAPRVQERQVWQSNFDRGVTLEDAHAELLAHNEFYTQADRDDRQYIVNMYMAVLGRRPQTQELDAWLSQLRAKNGLRREIAREFLAGVNTQR